MSKSASARGFALPDEVLRARRELARSGAAGVHADQNSRRARAAGRVNRVGTRRARTSAAVRDQQR